MSLVRVAFVASFTLLAACASPTEEPEAMDATESNLSADAASAPTCRSDERVIFTCRTTKKKIVAVCASSDLSATSGYIQYRYGTNERTELELPEAAAVQSFRQITTYSHSDPERSASFYFEEIQFASSDRHYTYSVSTSMGHGREEAGVRVAKDGRVIAEIQCDGDYTNIDGDAVAKAGVVVNDGE